MAHVRTNLLGQPGRLSPAVGRQIMRAFSASGIRKMESTSHPSASATIAATASSTPAT